MSLLELAKTSAFIACMSLCALVYACLVISLLTGKQRITQADIELAKHDARLEGVKAGLASKAIEIERARHAGWNEGREYQIALEQRRHPRAKDGKFVSRT